MSELRESFDPGSSNLRDFYGWMIRRHEIYLKRVQGLPKPWTDDPILRDFKFTNVFRELDRGTLALRKMEQGAVAAYQCGDWEFSNTQQAAELLLFNTWWYRIWNLDVHAEACGFVSSYDALEAYMRKLDSFSGARMWTSAHMIRGQGGERKVDTYLKMMKSIWDQLPFLTAKIQQIGTLQGAFDIILETPLIGDFTAYEIVSDLRHHILAFAPDIYVWANPGNGAIRGMRRLGLEPTVGTIQHLWQFAPAYLKGTCLDDHFPFECHLVEIHDDVTVEIGSLKAEPRWPPFELREIEHSLCEFDKYERARLGQGRPRQRFNGAA